MEMSIRPMDIVIDPYSEVAGTVKSVTFLGGQYDYFIDLFGTELRVQRNALDVIGERIHEEGERVGLRFLNPRFYPREETTA